ncbi:TetR/AcrR family transcriptional regulator [Amphritea opalescens]|uniref:TetR/AcrR family transcriptional regulator n=1 Tax=Amphritea opalescens TaxID=2490544 RepID=A0A430KT59_9GAMM|nr:TetR/AcrR family transcriptional regulator [Amphritea opalescens]RTE66689.1 TetR/AcrR family transcriptional regulator [Amphritea opalescens]
MTTIVYTEQSEISRKRIMMAALDLFAESELDAVSMRMINRAAGYRNNSALHYHFGSKQGLFESLVTFIQEWFNRAREKALKSAEAKAELSGSVDAHDIVEAFITPYIRLLEEEEWGYPAIRFLARMEFDGASESYAYLIRLAESQSLRFQALLAVCLPHIPEKIRHQRFNFFITSVMQGLAEYKNLNRTYMNDIDAASYREYAEIIIDYSAAGLEAPLQKQSNESVIDLPVKNNLSY